MLGENDAITVGHCFVERDLRQADAVYRSKKCRSESEKCTLGSKHGSTHYKNAQEEGSGGGDVRYVSSDEWMS